MAQSFYPSKHTGKEIDDAVDLTKQLNTTVNQLSDTKLDKNTTTKNQLYWVNASGNQANLPFQSSLLTSSDDLDNITTYGVYQIYTASVPANVPLTGVNAILTVYNAAGGSQHVCQHYSTHTGYMFERYAQYNSGVLTWGEWKQIATQIVQILPVGSDANKLGKTALYATSTSKVTNVPTSIEGNFTLLVYQGASSGNVTQVIYTHNTNNTHTGIDKPCSVYVRDINNFNDANPYWSAWTNLYTEANPSGEATGGVLSKILINDVIYSVGGGGTGTVDTEMSDDSTNAVQNKVIKNYVDTTTENIVKVMPTSINKTNNKIYLVHDGDKLTGQIDIALPECPFVDDGTELDAELLKQIQLAGCFLDETTYEVYYVVTADEENGVFGFHWDFTDAPSDKVYTYEWSIGQLFADRDVYEYEFLTTNSELPININQTMILTDSLYSDVTHRGMVSLNNTIYQVIETSTGPKNIILRHVDKDNFVETYTWTIGETIKSLKDTTLADGDNLLPNPSQEATDILAKIRVWDKNYTIVDKTRDVVTITADTVLTTNLINKIVSAKSILVDGETDLYRLLENTTNTLVLQYMDATLYTITISWTLNQKWSEALSQDKQLLTSDDIQANPTATPTQELNKINIQGTVYSIPTGGGSSTIDTEMSDTSINAVQNKVIKSYVDDIKNISYTINNSKYWSNSGKMLDAVNYYATDKINVSNYQNQILHINTALDAVSFIVFFDKYNNKLSTIPYDGTDYKDYVVTVPEDAYFVGVTLKDTTGKLSIKITADNLATADVKSADKVYDISSEFEIKNYTIQNDTYYYGVNGTIQQNSGYYTVTFRADIFVGLNLEVFTRLDNGIAAIVFLNSEKSKIDAITDTTRTYKKYTSTIPTGTKYIGISCFGSAEQYPIRIFVKTISQGLYNTDNILESQQEEYTALTYNSDGGDARIFTHWGAIGDSLSNGVLEYYDDTGVLKADVDRNYSFIQFIGRKLNVFAHNYSKGGTTAKEIYILNQDDMFDSKEQIYTLAFGTNDAGLTEYTGGWGTAADINIDDYTQNADSFVGYMARIIQRIRVNNPGAIFFLLTKPLAPQDEQLAAIQAVASVLPDVYVIDMTQYSKTVLNKKVNNKPLYTVGAHCSVMGYKLMADFILNSIANVVKADPTHFNTSYKIGADETKTADYTWATEGYVNNYVDQKVTDAINTSILQVINANY